MELKKVNKHLALFSGQDLNYNAQIFTGANLRAIFGGITLDLTNAKIENNAEIKVCVICGGVDIIAPRDAEVVVKSTSLFGGVDNKVDTKDANETIYVKSICIFGGCDIKNEKNKK